MAGNLLKDLFKSPNKYGVTSPLVYVDADKLPLEVLLLERNNLSITVTNGNLGVSRMAFLELADGLRVVIDEIVAGPRIQGVAVYQIEIEHPRKGDSDNQDLLLEMSATELVSHVLDALSVNGDEVAFVCLDDARYLAILEGMLASSPAT